MLQATRESARAFVQAIEMPSRAGEAVVETRPVDFDQLKNQAAVVGSEVVSFVKGITAERRQDVVNATLPAQLAANKKIPDRKRKLADRTAGYVDALDI